MAATVGTDREHGWASGFTTLDEESALAEIPVEGTIPEWLNGTLIRNGPGRFENAEGPVRHWFFGLAMLHMFSIAEGGVAYANRYLDSEAYRRSVGEDEIDEREFAADPCRSIFKRVVSGFVPRSTDNAVINVAHMGDRFVALTESRLAVEFDPETLATVGVVSYDDDLEVHADTAHPHTDSKTGDSINHSVRVGPRSTYLAYRLPRGSNQRRAIGSITVREPGYIHSFGLTERFVVLAEFPYLVSPWSLLRRGRPFFENFRWHPERPTRFFLLDRASGTVAHAFEAPATFAFHHVNAFERDGDVVVDLIVYPDNAVIDSFYMEAMRGGHPYFPDPMLHRFRLPLGDGRVREERLSDEPFELPRINYAHHNTRDYRFVYGVGNDVHDFGNRLVKVDTETGTAQRWEEGGCYPGEPVFVAQPTDRGEDSGVVLSVVLDAAADKAFLLVLDAETFAEHGRAHVPHHIPFGFHGKFFDAKEL